MNVLSHPHHPRSPAIGASRPGRLAFGAAVWCAALLASGCAWGPVGVPAGAGTDELIKTSGQPVARLERNGQQRWEYGSGSFGKFTWMVDLDAAGKVKSVEQVLTEASFAQIRAGQKADDLRWALGKPSELRGAWRGAQLWSYRYDTQFCQWFVVTVESTGEVRDAGYTPDPMCTDGESRSPT
ncbi:MAG: hypothetical protein RL375_3135 [Pseudomonadota bacterium]